MRIGELSQVTGVPVPTIKYYLREGLLPHGELTSPNQARYEESHVRRVRLVRALIEVGGLSIAVTREVLTKINDCENPIGSIGKAHYAISARPAPHEDAALTDAFREVDELIERRGWQIRETSPARAALAEALAYVNRLGHKDAMPLVADYADAADKMAAREVDLVLSRRNPEAMAETAVTITVLGDALMAALRRMAQETEAVRRLGGTNG